MSFSGVGGMAPPPHQPVTQTKSKEDGAVPSVECVASQSVNVHPENVTPRMREQSVAKVQPEPDGFSGFDNPSSTRAAVTEAAHAPGDTARNAEMDSARLKSDFGANSPQVSEPHSVKEAGGNSGVERPSETDLSADHKKLYADINLKISPATLPTKRVLVKELTLLDKGRVAAAYEGRVKDQSGHESAVVFKELPKMVREDARGALMSGIPLDDPQIAMRNIATRRLAEELGFSVIPPIDVAIREVPGKGEVIGMETAKATGIRGDKLAAFNSPYEISPAVRPGLMELQLLDAIAAQVDRNSTNFFIDLRKDDTCVVTGIDHDFSFGKEITNPDFMTNPHLGLLGVKMPPVIDKKMFDAVTSLTGVRLAEILQDLLSPDEIASANERLTALKNHVRDISVIDPQGWGDDSVGTALFAGQDVNSFNSYIAREAEFARNDSMPLGVFDTSIYTAQADASASGMKPSQKPPSSSIGNKPKPPNRRFAPLEDDPFWN
jgi:hypothetical protein